jgi:single-strand DNA-binding protein
MLKAQIIGNLGGDPEIRYSADGKPFVRMNVAANYRNRSPEGEWQDKTEWIRVTVIGQRAEFLGQYLRKGSKIYAEGRLEARPWTDQQGQIRAGLEVVANEVEFMSTRADDEARSGDSGRVGAGVGVPTLTSETFETAYRAFLKAGAGAPAGRSSGARSQPAPTDDAELEDLPF